MSRLTASLFHKPSPFELPNPFRPLSPPETNSDYAPPMQTSDSIQLTTPLGADDSDSVEALPSAPIPDPGSRFRRTSSLTYNNSSLRDSRERSSPRTSRPLVVVIPPLAFVQEHGQLGHTLSSGPLHRLSQGILMPLFPTMYAQLTAIAREFNFPSTAGLCLYLYFSDGGVLVTPRISDDVWPTIWSSALESQAHPLVNPITTPFNIAGRFQFDIDLDRARWYPSWLSSSRRGVGDIPMPVGQSHAQSVSHSRLESRTTDTEDQIVENRPDDLFAGQQHNASVTSNRRHVPKKLSLVERFDASLMPSGPKHVEPHALSPVVQEGEPKIVKYDLERRVNSWIAGASFRPSPIVSKGQTTLQPNIPKSPSLDPNTSPHETSESEPNLDEFSWSPSSLGPSSYDIASPSSPQHRLPSIHLADRMEYSVGLTPSICTSFGPPDYDIYPPLSPAILTPFVDLGQRMIEDVPVTPSSATTWGPPSWPASPLSMHIARSVNLGERSDLSLPATPSTATSWGAPLSYPPSPRTPYYIPTPDLGQRAFDLSSDVGARSTTPTTALWDHVWPYRQNGSRDEGGPATLAVPRRVMANQSLLSTKDSEPSGVISKGVASPHHSVGKSTWAHVWPYRRPGSENEEEQGIQSTQRQTTDDCHCLSSDESSVRQRPLVFPYYNARNGIPRPHVLPFHQRGSTHEEPEVWEGGRELTRSQQPLVPDVLSGYPHFNIYFVNQPFSSSQSSSLLNVKLSVHYPIFDLYPAVYPNIIPYPPMQESTPCNPTRPTSQYPDFNIFQRYLRHNTGNLSYPYFNLYPSIYSSAELLPKVQGALDDSVLAHCGQTVYYKKPAAYPLFDLYPAVYPHFELYPEVQSSLTDGNRVETGLIGKTDRVTCDLACQEQGAADITPLFVVGPIYPHFELYPPTSRMSGGPQFVSTKSPANYPAFNLYPAVYPYFELYLTLVTKVTDEDSITPPGFYPADITRHANLDASFISPKSEEVAPITVRLTASYPVFDLYPPVYPNFELWPSFITKLKPEESTFAVRSTATYPIFMLYPPVYPHFDLWPSVHASTWPPDGNWRKEEIQIASNTLPKLTHSGGLVPSINGMMECKPSKSHAELHFSVFPDGNVVTPSGTPSQIASQPFNENIVRARPLQVHNLSAAESRAGRGARSRSGSISVRPVSDVPGVIKKLPVVPNTPTRKMPTSSPSLPDVRARLRKLPPTPSNLAGLPANRFAPDGGSPAKEHPDTAVFSRIVERRGPLPSPPKIGTDAVRRHSMMLQPKAVNNSIPSSDRASSRRETTSALTLPPLGQNGLSKGSYFEKMDLPDALARFPMPPLSAAPSMPPVSRSDRARIPSP